MSGNSHQRRVRRRAWQRTPEGRRYRFLVERDGPFAVQYLWAKYEAIERRKGLIP